MTPSENKGESKTIDMLLAENEGLLSEIESMRSAVSIMSIKMVKYHQKAMRMQRAYQKSGLQSTQEHLASKIERLEKVLKLSHRSFLKMEEKNKELSRRLQIRNDLQLKPATRVSARHHVSDTSDVSADESSVMVTSSIPVLLPFDDECEIIFSSLPPLKF